MENLVTSSAADAAFWSGKKVFVTGHSGFKGGWLSIWLKSLGAEVIGFSIAPTQLPCLFEEARVSDDMTSLIGDIRDLSALSASIKSHRPEIIFHMAAQPLVRSSYVDPVETYATNVMGTVNLLESARQVDSVKVIVNVTTDKCYENREWAWGYRETEAMGGYDPYSSSKGCSELVTSAYRNSFLRAAEVSVASARAGNVIGGGDWAIDRLVPDALRALQNKQSFVVRNPNAIRPWQHVLEPLSGYLLLAKKMYGSTNQYSEAWNFGPRDDDAKTVSWIASNICHVWGDGASWVTDDGDHPHEANYLKLDISKARSDLGWQPRWTLRDSLSRIVKWHKSWQEGFCAETLCLNEINDFYRLTE